MGPIVEISCNCGYESERLFIGSHYDDYDPLNFDEVSYFTELCYCENCSIITTIDVDVEGNEKSLFQLLKEMRFMSLFYYFLGTLFRIKPNSCGFCNNTVSMFENDLFCPVCKSVDNIDYIEVGCWD